MSFTWIPLYSEIARKLLKFQDQQSELLGLLGKLLAQGLKVISLTDRDASGKEIPLAAIDPFTFFASFNRTPNVSGRQAILAKIKEAWQLSAEVPKDFDGIPIINPQNSWAFAFLANRQPDDIPVLWQAAKEGIEKDWRTFDRNLFDKALGVRQMGLTRLTMSLFWVNPKGFLSFDKNTEAYFHKHNIVCETKTAAGYFAWLEKAVAKVGGDFPQISLDAYEADKTALLEQGAKDDSGDGPTAAFTWPDHADLDRGTRVWFENTKSSHGHGGPGWEFGTCLWSPSKARDGKDWYRAMREVQPDDLVLHCSDGELHGLSFAKMIYSERTDEPPMAGTWAGMVPYYRIDVVGFSPLPRPLPMKDFFDQKTNEIKQEIQFIRSQANQEQYLRPPFDLGDSDKLKLGQTYLTHCSHNLYKLIRDWAEGHTKNLGKPASVQTPEASSSGGVCYWWLNVNPKIWNIRNAPIGFVQTYTSHNEKGNKRQKYKHFAAIRPGHQLLGYLTTPDKEIVAVCEVTKGLHATASGDAIEFRITEKFSEPVTLAELQSEPALAECEPIKSNQGSLFAVTEDEYDTIREFIDKRNALPVPEVPDYAKADALKDLFMTESRLDEILSHLGRKQAIILQGPPGVGKTFIAKRIAFTFMKKRDERRIEMVQFHPSYSYEDFVQGYRPTKGGAFVLRDGVFHRFARRARNDPGRKWFFIIDEINRGNLAKIFGELLMLLEADKRGPKYAIPLTYSEEENETFDFPKNLYVIGTMNTADRSLAMVDYALRRRFAFVTLQPAFDSPSFAAWLTSPERGASKELLARIRTRVNALNAEIQKERDLGAGFRIGHSFFCPLDGQVADDAWYREVVLSEIKPLLEEYFDSPERVEKLVSELLA